MSFKDKIFKNQSPWGTPPPGGGGSMPGGNGSGSRQDPPNLDDIIKNFQKTINKFSGGKSGGSRPIVIGLLVILGLIDNMSFFKGDDGKEYKIFGESGVEKTAPLII